MTQVKISNDLILDDEDDGVKENNIDALLPDVQLDETVDNNPNISNDLIIEDEEEKTPLANFPVTEQKFYYEDVVAKTAVAEEEEEDVVPTSDEEVTEDVVTENILGDFLQSSQGTEALGAGVYDKQMAQFRKETDAENTVSEQMKPTPNAVIRTGLSELDFIDPEITNFTDRTEKLVDGALETVKAIELNAQEQGISEDEYVQKNIYNNMEEGPLRSILELTEATGFKALMYFQYGFGKTVGGFADGVEFLATEAQTAYPDAYKKITSRDPRSFANQITRDAGDLLMSVEGASLNVFAKSSKDIARSAGINIPRFTTGVGQSKKFIREQRQKNWGDRFFNDAKIKPTGFDTRKLDRIKLDLAKEANVPSTFRDAKLDPNLLKVATLETSKKAEQLASKTASKYVDDDPSLLQELQEQVNLDSRSSETLKITASATTSPEKIARVEAITGKTISKVDEETGELVIDPDQVRLSGIEVLDEKSQGIDGSLFNPTLSVESFDSLISVVGDLKKRHPKYFDNIVAGDNYIAVQGATPKPRLTDKIFNAMVEEDLVGDPEFLNSLTKYGMKFEDFMLAVMGSSSQAGKLLNKVSQLSSKKTPTGRGVPKSEKLSLTKTKKEIKELEEQGYLGRIFSGFVRWEGIRRGLLVSMLKTAARNVSSFLIRSPLEGVENYLDTALYNLANEGIGKGARSLVSWTNVKDSFRHMKYAFSFKNYMDQKEYVDFILADKSMGGLHKKLFDNINEIRKGREFKGNGKITKGANAVFETVEAGVDILNIPNRFQEFVTRRATFLAELQRLVQREYNVNFIEEINNGKLSSFINDSMAPNKNAKSFYTLAAEAGEKALDVTYAKTPDVPAFRRASDFIVESGLTVVIDFPRFMFNGMELIAQYSLGSLLAVGQKAFGAKNLNRMGRKYLTRNITGLGAIYGFYKYLESDDAPEDYKEVRVGPNYSIEIDKLYEERRNLKNSNASYGEIEGRHNALTRRMEELSKKMQEPSMSIDVSGHYPAKQIGFLAKVAQQAIRARGGILDYDKEYYMGTYWPEARKNLATFFETSQGKELIEVIAGSGFSRGFNPSRTTEVLVDLFQPGELDNLSGRRLAEKVAAGVGNYVQTHAVKLIEIAEIQRILGYRTMERKDVANDPSAEINVFLDNMIRPARQSGIASIFDPASESERPTRVSVFGKDRQIRYKPTLNLLFGINLRALPNEAGEYLQSLGIPEFQAGAKKSIVPSYQRLGNEYIQKRLPVVTQLLKDSLEPEFELQYFDSGSMTKERVTKEDFVKGKSLMYMNKWLSNMRSAANTFANVKTAEVDPDKALFYRSIESYSKLPRKQRVASSSLFIQLYNRAPEIYNTKDLQTLIALNTDTQKQLNKVKVQ